jgi:RNA polymerase sigma-70 factor (ECF subfamily)
MKPTQNFEPHRSQLFYTAYRMLGSAMEAEDMVQETYLRYVQADHSSIENLQAYLTTIITRLCLDHLKSARVQREQYLGPWLPEPIMTENLPAQTVAQKDTLTMAFLLLLEKLSPVERVIFLLREVFAYDYAEIAHIVDKSEANCRQLFSRAKKHLVTNRPQFELSSTVQQQVITDFMTALNEGNTPQMLALLAPDVTFWSDGGGKVTAARHPVSGQENVMRFAQGIFRQRPDNMQVELVETNGTQSLLIRFGEQIFGVMNFTIANNQIQQVHTVLNPDKLHHLGKPTPRS